LIIKKYKYNILKYKNLIKNMGCENLD
jgi:hypothetical protein